MVKSVTTAEYLEEFEVVVKLRLVSRGTNSYFATQVPRWQPFLVTTSTSICIILTEKVESQKSIEE